MTLSKVERIFMASWGSIRPSLIRSSRVSVRHQPMLQPCERHVRRGKRRYEGEQSENQKQEGADHTCCCDTARNKRE